MTPEWLGKRINVGFFETMKKAFGKTVRELAKQPPFFEELKGLGIGQKFIDFYNSSDAVKAEVPSVNFRGNARGCAKLASIMANQGQDPSGKQILSKDTWEKMHKDPKEAHDAVLGNYHAVLI